MQSTALLFTIIIQLCQSMRSYNTIPTLITEFNIKHPWIVINDSRQQQNIHLKLLKDFFKKNETAGMNTWFPNITGSSGLFPVWFTRFP